jgi:PmbA protein
MEEILAKAKKSAQEAEVYQVLSEETQVRFEANKLKQLQTSQSTSVALRVVKDGRIGYATTTGISDAARLVNDAVETAEFGSEAKFTLPGRESYPGVEVYDPAANNVTTKDMVGLGEQMVAAITKSTPGIMCEGGVSRGVITVRLANSKGGKAEFKKSFFSLGIEGTVVTGSDMLFVGESDSSCHPISDPSKVIDTVLRQLARAKRQAKAATRKMPVIFTPDGIVSAFIMPLLSALNGKTVLEGASPLGQKIGKKVFDTHFSLYDDPTIDFRPASRPCDDEGVPSQRTALVENGTVKAFLYDLQTAALAGKKSTGSGNRGRGGLPAPAPSALIISPGKTTFNDMLKDIKEGLVVEQLMGAEQGNLLAGDFSGNVLLGYKVENGEIVGRVKDTMVSGNVYSILKNIAAIGSEARWVSGFLQAPPFYCKGLSVSSKG